MYSIVNWAFNKNYLFVRLGIAENVVHSPHFHENSSKGEAVSNAEQKVLYLKELIKTMWTPLLSSNARGCAIQFHCIAPVYIEGIIIIVLFWVGILYCSNQH